ncbi:MAG: hypothetical protein Q4A74_05590 [Cardiobacteriaceae bacterium]|nr:hypothetical protein [Cardiobacteriaceae bacterium]
MFYGLRSGKFLALLVVFLLLSLNYLCVYHITYMDMGVRWFEFIVKYLGEAVLAEVVSSVMNVVSMSILALTDIGVGEPPPGFENFEKILKYCANAGLGVGVFGIIGVGAMMTTSWGRRQASEHTQALVLVSAGCVVIAGASGIVKALTGA